MSKLVDSINSSAIRSRLLWILEVEERNAVWLSKKIDCSHTLCYNWLKGEASISKKYQYKIRDLFGGKYDI